jgi:pimeloyl-ACP methyl ester carboxylesterase
MFGSRFDRDLREPVGRVSYVSPWSFDLTDIRCPVFIWFGDQDDRLDDAAWLSDHVTDPRVVIWPGEGHLAYKPHLPEILDALLTRPVRQQGG